MSDGARGASLLITGSSREPVMRGENMPRYLVERSFDGGLTIPLDETGLEACLSVVGQNAAEGVTWVHSYVTPDTRKTYCIYDGPDREAIRRAATRNSLPIDSISEVRVLDPYFYRPSTVTGG